MTFSLPTIWPPAFMLCALLACHNAPGPPPPAAYTATPPATAVPAPSVDIDYLTGKFEPASHPDFVAVGAPFTDKPGMMLRREAFESFQKMWTAAGADGVSLKIISSTRTFAQQKAIWEGKWTRFAAQTPDPEARARRILEYSAMPGASRHHWGTDIDLNDLNNPSFEAGGAHEKVYRWLAAHGHEYGFCQPYTAKDSLRPAGYNEEKWHWSYTPLSRPLLAQYLENLNDDMLTGFSGAETARTIEVVKNYAGGINTACR